MSSLWGGESKKSQILWSKKDDKEGVKNSRFWDDIVLLTAPCSEFNWQQGYLKKMLKWGWFDILISTHFIDDPIVNWIYYNIADGYCKDSILRVKTMYESVKY